MREKCPYSELIWSAFSLYSVRMQENTDQDNSEYEDFLPSVNFSLMLTLKGLCNAVTQFFSFKLSCFIQFEQRVYHKQCSDIECHFILSCFALEKLLTLC